LNLAYPEEVLTIWLYNYINILSNPTGVAKSLMVRLRETTTQVIRVAVLLLIQKREGLGINA
jgi:hypothetical protein